MSFIKKIFGGDKKAGLEKDMHHFDLVLRRLENLKQRRLISNNDFSDEMIIYNGENTPRIISTIDRIFHKGYFSGIETSVEKFCYLIGMGVGLDKLKTPKSRIKLINTEINKYFDEESGGFRYSRFDYYEDESDELWEHIEGFHTVPVDENVTYEYANSISISFKHDAKQYDKKQLEHQSLVNPKMKTRGSTYKWVFQDGSLMTSLLTYRDQTK